MISHKIIDTETNETIDLEVVTGYEIPSSQSIVINEAATGNSGVTYNNGRTQEEIPVNGTLLARDREELNRKITKLISLKDKGKVIEYIRPIRNLNRSNKFFIQEATFDVNKGTDDSVPFNMTLSEYRNSNVKRVRINLVGLRSKQEMVDYYESLTGDS